MKDDSQEVNATKRVHDVPPVMQIGQTTVAASAAGQGIVVLYRDFSGPLLTAIWAHHCGEADPKHVDIVNDQRTCRDAANSLGQKRLVLVQEPNLLQTLARTVEGKILRNASGPAIFCRYSQADCEDLAIPTLVLRANATTLIEVGVWLNNSDAPSLLVPVGRLPTVNISGPIESHLNLLLASSRASYDECEVVRALLKGTALSNVSQERTPDHIEAGHEDFLRVKKLLACPGVTDPEGIPPAGTPNRQESLRVTLSDHRPVGKYPHRHATCYFLGVCGSAKPCGRFGGGEVTYVPGLATVFYDDI